MKIGDFGLARSIYEMDYYRKTTDVSKELAILRRICLSNHGRDHCQDHIQGQQ